MKALAAFGLIHFIIFLACCDFARAGWGTVVSKGAQKLALKEARQQLKRECAEYLIKKDQGKIAQLGLRNLDDLAVKAGHPSRKISTEISRSPLLYKKLGFDSSAISFGIKHGIPGRILLEHVPLETLKASKWLDHARLETVQEAASLCQPGVAGSWKKLTKLLKKNDFNRGERDVCEHIFKRSVEIGKVPELKGAKIVDGHGQLGRHGIDFIAVTKDEKLQVIEFGTSTKPIDGEMSWSRIRDRLSRSNLPPDVLGSLGYGPEKRLQLQKALQSGNDHNLSLCVQRVVAAPEILRSKLVDGPGEILSVPLY
jgi:hypothetical protein